MQKFDEEEVMLVVLVAELLVKGMMVEMLVDLVDLMAVAEVAELEPLELMVQGHLALVMVVQV